MRALGIRYGYYPNDPMERWQVDSTIEAIADIFENVARCYFSQSEDLKQAALETLTRCKLPKFMSAMNTRLAASAQDGKNFLVGHELTIADFALGSFFLQTVVNV